MNHLTLSQPLSRTYLENPVITVMPHNYVTIESSLLSPHISDISKPKPKAKGFGKEVKYYDPAKRQRSGVKGITVHGRYNVGSALAVIEKEAGSYHNCQFSTLTQPVLPRPLVKEEIKELVRYLTRSIRDALKEEGLKPYFVMRCEVQVERWEQHQECALHWHIVSIGRIFTSEWFAKRLRFIYRKFFGDALANSLDYSSCANVQKVEYSLTDAEKGLSPYLQKQTDKPVIKEIRQLGLDDYLPYRWVHMSGALKQAIKDATQKFRGEQAQRFMNRTQACIDYGLLELMPVEIPYTQTTLTPEWKCVEYVYWMTVGYYGPFKIKDWHWIVTLDDEAFQRELFRRSLALSQFRT